MTEQELYNEYRKSDCKSFTDFLINKIAELKNTYRKQRNKRIDVLQKENAELKDYRLTTLAKQQTDMSKYALNLEHKLSWYDDQLTKAKELIKTLLLIADKKVSQMEFQLCVADAKQFLNSEVEK